MNDLQTLRERYDAALLAASDTADEDSDYEVECLNEALNAAAAVIAYYEARHDALLGFVQDIADTPVDGDLDEDGGEIEIENDDAWSFTLGTVNDARKLLGGSQ